MNAHTSTCMFEYVFLVILLLLTSLCNKVNEIAKLLRKVDALIMYRYKGSQQVGIVNWLSFGLNYSIRLLLLLLTVCGWRWSSCAWLLIQINHYTLHTHIQTYIILHCCCLFYGHLQHCFVSPWHCGHIVAFIAFVVVVVIVVVQPKWFTNHQITQQWPMTEDISIKSTKTLTNSYRSQTNWLEADVHATLVGGCVCRWMGCSHV